MQRQQPTRFTTPRGGGGGFVERTSAGHRASPARTEARRVDNNRAGSGERAMNALHLIENCIDSTGDEVGRVLRQGSVAKEALVRSWDTEAQALRQLAAGPATTATASLLLPLSSISSSAQRRGVVSKLVDLCGPCL